MDKRQEPKYRAVADHYPENDGLAVQIRDGYLINRHSGERIPDDEPVFIFRARDIHAQHVLLCYLNMIASGPAEHYAAVKRRLEDFGQFAVAHPERMKRPDTEQPHD